MPGIFDFLGSVFGGGGGDGGGDSLFGDVSNLGSTGNPFDFSGGNPFADFAGSFGGSNPFSGIDPSIFGIPGGSDPFSFGGTTPSNFNVDPGLFGLPGSNPFGTGSGGGTPLPLQTIGTGINDISRLLTPGQTPNVPAGSLTTSLPGQITPTGGGGAGGIISSLLGTTPGTGVLGTGITLPQLLSGLGLGGSLLQGNKLPPGADQLQKLADSNQQLVNNQLMPTALANQQGNINGQALSAIDRRLQKSEAGMREKYAAMGMTGSTMEQEDLAGLRANAQDQVFAEGQQMATTGLQTAATLTGQDATIYNELMQAQVQQDEELSKAIAAFAGAAAR